MRLVGPRRRIQLLSFAFCCFAARLRWRHYVVPAAFLGFSDPLCIHDATYANTRKKGIEETKGPARMLKGHGFSAFSGPFASYCKTTVRRYSLRFSVGFHLAFSSSLSESQKHPKIHYPAFSFSVFLLNVRLPSSSFDFASFVFSAFTAATFCVQPLKRRLASILRLPVLPLASSRLLSAHIHLL